MHIPNDILLQALAFFERGHSSKQISEMEFCKSSHITERQLRQYLEESHEAKIRKEESHEKLKELIDKEQEGYRQEVVNTLKTPEKQEELKDTYEKLLSANKEFTKFVTTGMSAVANSFKDLVEVDDKGQKKLINASKESYMKLGFVNSSLQTLALFIQTVTHSNSFIRDNPYQFKEEQTITTHEYLEEVSAKVKERQDEMLAFSNTMKKPATHSSVQIQ